MIIPKTDQKTLKIYYYPIECKLEVRICNVFLAWTIIFCGRYQAMKKYGN